MKTRTAGTKVFCPKHGNYIEVPGMEMGCPECMSERLPTHVSKVLERFSAAGCSTDEFFDAAKKDGVTVVENQ